MLYWRFYNIADACKESQSKKRVMWATNGRAKEVKLPMPVGVHLILGMRCRVKCMSVSFSQMLVPSLFSRDVS